MRNNRILVFYMLVFLIMASIVVWVKPSDIVSGTERRPLEQFPDISIEEILSGDFMSDFESYVTDQFPMRDGFRRLKAIFSTGILGQKDVHGIYVVDGYACEMEYPLNEAAVQRSVDRLQYVYERYMKDTKSKVYYAIIPDKNYYLADVHGYLTMDYERFFEMIREGMDGMTEISVVDLLSMEDYYKTDIHWRQDQILDVSNRILVSMGNTMHQEYEIQTLDVPFYGVYAGQSGLFMNAETIMYSTNNMLDQCVVYDYETDQTSGIYDMGKAYGRDPYEMFLSGPKSLLTIENPNVLSDKELIIFRDSFGSSIAPLLVESYAKITLVDIRYIHPDFLGKYIEFGNQDVLFLYSISVLNNGDTMK